MDRNIDIQNELEEISAFVAGLPSQHPYQVDASYWDTLAAGVAAQIHLQTAGNVTYSAPPGYFSNLAETILSRVTHADPASANEPEHLVLPGSSIMPYEVPAQYFEQLSNSITSRITRQAQQAPVVQMKPKIRQMAAYAAAAAVAAIMVAGAFLFTDNSESYSSLKDLDVSGSVARLSEAEIESYLNSQPASLSPVKEEESSDMQAPLRNMSEDEIQQYLQENNDPAEQPVKGI
ncbi:hypothetical protein [Deminuibacter soli]|uniref:Uncharacterized protein n=1 Tax=Deminuibacter soli TaxID=2291815 RepID=A0A3E1NQ16_9BACT|nr:hypothetical protein [Deminuibacter soli]RFM29914.1 hypothetical protein DXN05_02765 [Deminuibacter soli]